MVDECPRCGEPKRDGEFYTWKPKPQNDISEPKAECFECGYKDP
jgi:hypothetical protein